MFPCRIENYKPCLLQILAKEPSNAWYVGKLFGKPAWSFPGYYFLADGEADHPIIVCGNGERVGLLMGMSRAPKLADVLAEIDRAEVQL